MNVPENRNVPLAFPFHGFACRNRKSETVRNPHKYSIKRLRCSIVPLIIYKREKDREIAIYTVYTPIYKYIAIFRDIGTACRTRRNTWMRSKLNES